MTAQIDAILDELTAFYDFRDKHVVHVGAGGGQLIGYAGLARTVTAVDNDGAAIAQLQQQIAASGNREKFTLVTEDFCATALSGDVVLFEFCLHEMGDPLAAIRHARNSAADVVVIGHAPGSRWMWYAGEEAKVERCWRAIANVPIAAQQRFTLARHFRDYAALCARFSGLGETSRRRIAEFESQQDIVIAMACSVFLVGGSG